MMTILTLPRKGRTGYRQLAVISRRGYRAQNPTRFNPAMLHLLCLLFVFLHTVVLSSDPLIHFASRRAQPTSMTWSTRWKMPRRRVVVLPDDILALRVSRPRCGSFVLTTRCPPISPIVYTFDSPLVVLNKNKSRGYIYKRCLKK